MALRIGDKAPDFRLSGAGASHFNLHRDMEGKIFILYFYPKNFTPGCTAEACGFRDHFDEFRDLDVEVIGISTDSVESHEKFRSKYKLPFVTLADTDGRVSTQYGAKIPFLNMSKRKSFLIDNRMRIAGIYENFFDGNAHIVAMIRRIRENAKLQ